VNDAATSIEPAERQAMAEAAQISEALPTSDDASIEPHTPPGKPDRVASLPPALPASSAATGEDGQSSFGKPLDTATSQASVREPHDPVTEKHPALSRDKHGPWAINLISTTSKDEAERFAEKAWSMDLQTELQQVTLKGTPYWRVQITGFSTAEDASVYAETAKERLGLKDVWILKH
jgi:hypothetical protein